MDRRLEMPATRQGDVGCGRGHTETLLLVSRCWEQELNAGPVLQCTVKQEPKPNLCCDRITVLRDIDVYVLN